ncbi:acyl-CoA thioesterase [Criblamydia sequanensis]|uniref:1,4-dihydroxy-2-naphthoyl-CoA hydrolase n=1 Tax=Candidatus Criblamydia sequanensis CRIB-18 TaxID=1437425 RepID=A0A090D2J6_9BACT|nr:thioesterase family protein [Criblamydia sequanensis]CDR34690.1 Conserved hypothetical protein [Criblamydia sequanensis CRIB-18]
MVFFIARNKVRMHDTDMAGLLYFARQFRFAHDALEDFVTSEGYNFDQVFHHEKFVFVIVHCEADYYAHLKVGDELKVLLACEHIGETSFTIVYRIYNQDENLVGTVKTVHVTLDTATRKKMTIPDKLRASLNKYREDSSS